MAGNKFLIVVVFLTATSLLVHSASVGGLKSTAEVLIKHVIPQKVQNATQEVWTYLINQSYQQ